MKNRRSLPIMADDGSARPRPEPDEVAGVAAGGYAQLQSVLDAIPFPAFLIDRQFNIVAANRAVALRNAGGNVIGATCTRVMHGTQVPPPDCPLPRAAQGGLQEPACEFEHPPGSGQWIRSELYPTDLPAPNGGRTFLHLLRDITAQRLDQAELRHSLDMQSVVNRLLKLGGEPVSLEEVLDAALQMLLSLPWLALEQRGAIFTADAPGELTMKVSRGMPQDARTACARVPFGTCLCGTAAERRAPLVTTHVGERHEVRFADMADHGHCCVPIMAGGTVLGVINVYVAPGHQCSASDLERLQIVAGTLGGVIRHRRAEEATARLATVVESTSDFACVADVDGRIQYANPALRRLIGGQGELRGKPLGELFAGWARRLVDTVGIPQAMKEGRWSGETSLRASDGTELPVSQVILAHRGPLGAVEYVSSIMRDIREQRQQLIQSEERYRMLLETSPDAILVHDGAVFRYANTSAVELLGAASPQELVGRRVTDVFHEEYRGIGLSRIRETIEGGHSPLRQMLYVRLDGEPIEVETTLSEVTFHDEPAVLMIVRDIRQRRRLEREVAADRQRLQLAHQAGHIGAFDWDLDSNRVVWTPELEALYGLPSGAFAGTYDAWERMIHPGDRAQFAEGIVRQLADRGEFQLEMRVLRADGEERWHDAWGRATHDDGGAGRRVVGVALDISDRKKTEHQLQDALRARNQLLAMLSHELRTPLTPALMAASSLESAPELPSTARFDATLIRHAIELEARLIDDLLDITRIGTGKLGLQVVATDPSEALDNALGICRVDASRKAIDLQESLRAGSCELQADPARLQQVFWNLLRNAIKFTPHGGSIRVETWLDEEGDRRFHARIADTGRGIAPELMPRLFTPFEQGGPEVTREFGGLGLGLAISKTLVDMQGGRIEAHSDGRGLGAWFTVSFPVAVARPRLQPTPKSDRQAPERRPLRILVVDDDRATSLVAARVLGKAGHRVVTAANVRDALEAFGRDTFDVLLSDISLPDGTGLDLVRAASKQRPIVAIALSGLGAAHDIEASKSAGFAIHLTKPISAERLLTAIAQAVPHSKP